MNILKRLGKELLRIFIYFTIFSLILSILYYFSIINNNILNYLRIIGFIIILYFNSDKESKRSNNFDILNGLLLGISIILIFIIISLLIKYKINTKLIIYYILILLVSLLGSFRKKKKR